jgi:uncharacterized tellurite resistance protein B-like protein
MRNNAIALALGKVIIAAAWVDGEIQQEEISCLKDLLYQLPELPREGWEALNACMASPVSSDDAAQWIASLSALLKTEDDRAFALYALERVVSADGVVTEQERRFMDQITCVLKGKSVDWAGSIDPLLKQSIKRRERAVSEVDTTYEGFVFCPKSCLEARFRRLSRYSRNPFKNYALPRAEARKLHLAGILMSAIVRADGHVDDLEVAQVIEFLQERWDLSYEEAYYVSTVCLNYSRKRKDVMRPCREFYEITDSAERVAFLDVLFKVALADGVLSEEEVQFVMAVAANLKLGHKEFHLALERFAGPIRAEARLDI